MRDDHNSTDAGTVFVSAFFLPSNGARDSRFVCCSLLLATVQPGADPGFPKQGVWGRFHTKKGGVVAFFKMLTCQNEVFEVKRRGCAPRLPWIRLSFLL